MRVICVNNIDYINYHDDKVITKFDLTIGKEYDAYIAIYESDSYYVVKNDSGTKDPYPLTFFMTLEEYRNKKLGEIGI